MSAKIASIDKNSLADSAGLKAGDTIVEINGIEIIDYLDYMYASCAEDIIIKTSDNEYNISNEDYEPLGIYFDTLLIDEPKSCHNKCVFCFIDQLPKNMRETCYFKDDDYRLSFLQGNYVTMTNMTDADVDRIIRYNIPRINISIHTTNPKLRCRMLHNKNAGKINEYLTRLAENGLNINAQIVLCRLVVLPLSQAGFSPQEVPGVIPLRQTIQQSRAAGIVPRFQGGLGPQQDLLLMVGQPGSQVGS